MSSPIFGARIPAELRLRLESYLEQTGQSKSELLIDALGQYLDNLNGTNTPTAPAPEFAQQLAAMEERLGMIEEILLEEYIEPQPQYVQRLRPVRSDVVRLQR